MKLLKKILFSFTALCASFQLIDAKVRDTVNLRNATKDTVTWKLWTSQVPCCSGKAGCKVTVEPGKSHAFNFRKETKNYVCWLPCITKVEVTVHKVDNNGNVEKITKTLDANNNVAAVITPEDWAYIAGTGAMFSAYGTYKAGEVVYTAITSQCLIENYTVFPTGDENEFAISTQNLPMPTK